MLNSLLAAGTLTEGDYTGFSFFIVNMAMLAATAFFFAERSNVAGKWRLSLSVSALITGIAAVHYYYMRDVWVSTGTSPTSFRYIDWVLTVPLMCVEFFLILRAIQAVSTGVFIRLILGSVIMLVFGYFGEAELFGERMSGAYHVMFVIGMLGWAIVLYEVFAGEASKVSAQSARPTLQKAFNTLRLFALFGWLIYPIGYYLPASAGLDVAYNLADAVNKIGFGLVIYGLARAESATEASPAAA
jgi:bacteriorhodopsin